MTEVEWQVATDPKPMLELLQGGTKRKRRLLVCAVCRNIWALMSDERSRKAVEVAERCDDGVVTEEEYYEASEIAHQAREDAWNTAYENDDFPASVASYSLETNAPLDLVLGLATSAGKQPKSEYFKKQAEQCQLVRDVFGNPFRPVAVEPEWLTSNVVALAQQMYDGRDFSAMPILADALQDSGCEQPEILNHCRGDGPHVRGCWVVDLLLGKE